MRVIGVDTRGCRAGVITGRPGSIGRVAPGSWPGDVGSGDVAAEIVREVNCKDLGVVIDSFHFYAGNSTLEMIEALDAKMIQIFNINDADDRPREELEDRHRLLPGLGILPLQEMISSFRKIGYDKVASVEIFRPEYWERDPFALARDAHAATERVLAEAR